MTDVCRKRSDCRLCGSARLRPALRLTPTPPANAFVPADKAAAPQDAFPLDVMFCEDCAHVQLGHVVDPSLLFEDYVYVSGTSPVFRRHFDGYAESIVTRLGVKGGLAVDIGSNDGVLLSALRGRGFEIQGVDPAAEIARRADAAGVPTVNGFFSGAVAAEIRAARGPAAVVTANNVMAHIDDLSSAARAVCGLLADDGVFCFEVSYLLDVYEKTLFDTIYHEHLDYHSVKPLVGFLDRHGLEMIAAERVSSHGGSIRIAAQKAGGPRAAGPSVAESVSLEEAAGLDRPETFAALAEKIEARKAELTAVLHEKKAQGRRIIGYGAPAKAATLMHHFGLGPAVLDFIVDDSPLKQGLLTPGLHIPVVPPAALDDKPWDDILILAWNFADPILDKLAPWIQQGRCAVVPLPEVKVISP
ncbi:MAG: class I SAM-dependent methyltransferase [Rhodospirillales bacterium]